MSGGTAGNFVYGDLPASVTLNANTTYYIVSQETAWQATSGMTQHLDPNYQCGRGDDGGLEPGWSNL